MLNDKFVKDNAIYLAGGCLIVWAFLSNGDKNNAVANRNAVATQIRNEQRITGLKLELSKQSLEDQKPIAKLRYENDCQLVVASNNTSYSTTITAGQPILDPIRKVPFTQGVFCDVYGNTGEVKPISGQYVIDPATIASVGDQSVVKTRIERQNQLNGTGQTKPVQTGGTITGRW